MTHSDKTEAPPNILKRGARRRVRTTAAQRAAMLAEYACSGLSGPAFARVAGVNYQTFACWRQQQRKAGAALLPAPGAAAAPSVRCARSGLNPAIASDTAVLEK